MVYAGLVAALCTTTVLEGLLRDDLTWPFWTTAYGVTCILATLWRNQSPLLVVAGVFGSQFVLRLISDHYGAGWNAPWSLAILLVTPFALTRRGTTALNISLGLAVLALFPAWLAFERNPGRGFGAAVMLFAPALAGLWSRAQAHRRETEQARARTRERTELAREIHDTVGHRLAVIAVQVQAARSGPLDDDTRELVGIIEEQATQALSEMRTLVGGLRGGDAPVQTLPRLEDLRRLGEGCEVSVEVEIEEALGDLEPSMMATVYRIAEEALTNALRHAQGLSEVRISLGTDADRVRLEVRDDGRGPWPGAGPFGARGYGLVGMGERVKLWGGEMDVGPHPEGGWRVQAFLPHRPKGAS